MFSGNQRQSANIFPNIRRWVTGSSADCLTVSPACTSAKPGNEKKRQERLPRPRKSPKNRPTSANCAAASKACARNYRPTRKTRPTQAIACANRNDKFPACSANCMRTERTARPAAKRKLKISATGIPGTGHHLRATTGINWKNCCTNNICAAHGFAATAAQRGRP